MVWALGAAGVLAVLAWALFFARRHRFAHVPAAPAPDESRDGARRETVRFAGADGSEIEGWLYLPAGPRPPLVLMAPGLTGTKEGPLEHFAWAFAAAGFAVLAIDFRSFGGSGGIPRHWLDPLRQIEDYRAAIAFVRGALPNRAGRIVLWGSSFSGAAAVCAAAREPDIAGVIAQVPYLGGVPVHPPGRLQIAGYIALSVCEMLGDALAGLFGVRLSPTYITTYGHPDDGVFAMSADNPSLDGGELHPFWASIPPQPRGGWENKMLVRGLQNIDKTDPFDDIAKIACPVLLIGAMRDDMIAFDRVRAAAGTLTAGGSRFVQFDCAHYDPYVAPLFARNVQVQVEFLESLFHLPSMGRSTGA